MRAVIPALALLAVVTSAATASAEEGPSEAVLEAAQAGNVNPIDLQGALNEEPGLGPWEYLYANGILARPKQAAVQAPAGASSAVLNRLACIRRRESENKPGATNPRSGAAGLYQFMPGTWRTTPQGKAGKSPYDPVAAHEAAVWMVNQGRIREWDVVRNGSC
jgi:soluble lytic murein transglycosylase-like protein